MGTTNTLDLNNRVTNLEKAVSGGDSAQANKTDIATEFSATTNYTAGCFVYYGGKLYQFNADHSAGAWDPTDAVEANVTDQIVSNASAIAGLTATDVAYDNTDSGLTATDVQGAVDEVANGLTMDRYQPPQVNVNGTFQLSNDILKHNIIILSLFRYGYGGSAVLQKKILDASGYSDGCIIYATNTIYALFTVSSTGLVKVTDISWSESGIALNVLVHGIF